MQLKLYWKIKYVHLGHIWKHWDLLLRECAKKEKNKHNYTAKTFFNEYFSWYCSKTKHQLRHDITGHLNFSYTSWRKKTTKPEKFKKSLKMCNIINWLPRVTSILENSITSFWVRSAFYAYIWIKKAKTANWKKNWARKVSTPLKNHFSVMIFYHPFVF